MKWKYLYSVLLILCCITILTSAVGDDNKDHLPHYYVVKAKDFFGKEQWDMGKQVLDEGLKTYPDDPDMRWLMGRYYYQYKDYDKSRYQLIKCIEFEYNHVQAKQLLVNVEEETKHYSSAICYVNELLEVNPYWRGLWRRKIELYRKQGNNVEADRLLKRISQIYPDDPTITKDLNYALEMSYYQLKKAGNVKEATSAMEQLIKTNPHNEEFYLELTNLYLQQGLTEKALETAAQGSQDNPASSRLVAKKVGILEEQCRYQEAMAYLREKMKRSNSPLIHTLYNDVLAEAARSARDSDPYILYGKIYASSKSNEALDFLLSTALTRGYDEDARFYLTEAKRRYGANNTDLLYKEYMLDLRTGNQREANGLLQKLYKANPRNYDIVYAMCVLRLQEAEKYMINKDWSEALPNAQFVVRKARQDRDLRRSAMEKMLTCYTEMKRYNEALGTLDTLHLHGYDTTTFIDKKAYLLDKMGKTTEALNLYYTAYKDSSDINREVYASAYEEMAIPYIKNLMQNGYTRLAHDASVKLLDVNPQSDLGLHYAINTSAALGNFDEFDKFTNMGLYYYPNDLFYKIKRATILDRHQLYAQSLQLLKPQLREYPDSPELIGAHSNSSEMLALHLLKNDSAKVALNVVDSALIYDENNKELKYTKGLAYEKLKQYDSAYVYQKFYQPSVAEVGEYNQHMRGLQNKTYRNEIGLEYLHARYADQDVIRSIATAEYTRKYQRNIYTGRINYKGMDGSNEGDSITGGTGIQVQAEWQHRFTPKITGMANIAVANKYFPSLAVNVGLSKQLKNDWEVGLKAGYRRLPDTKQYVYRATTTEQEGASYLITGPRDMFTLTPDVSKTWYPFWTNAKVDLIALGSKFYYNTSAQAKYFLNDDGRTNIQAMAGFGSFPEMSVVDNSLIRTFSHTNTMVGLGGQFLVTKHLTLGLLGTWYTYYNTYYTLNSANSLTTYTRYKNLYNVYFQVYINF